MIDSSICNPNEKQHLCSAVLRFALFITFCAAFSVLKAQLPIGGGLQGGMGMASSAPADSAKTLALKRSDPGSQSFRNVSLGMDTFYTWDSTLPLTQRFNPVRRNGNTIVDLGHFASPQKDISLLATPNFGLQSGFNPYPFQNKDARNFRFYDAKVPLTRFSYFQGSGGFVSLDALHTQNLTPGWNVTLDYSSVINTEFYDGSKQNHLHRGTSIGSFYQSPNKRFKNITTLTWNRARRNENGGMENDTLLFRDDRIAGKRNPDIDSRGLYYPRLSDAKSFYGARRHVTENQFYNHSGNSYVFHKAEWNRTVFRYFDPSVDTGFYGSGYLLSADTINDSSAWNGLNNQIGLGFKSTWNKVKIFGKVAFNHEWLTYFSKTFLTGKDQYFSQGITTDVAAITKNWNINANAAYYFNGYNAGDYFIQADARMKVSKKMHLLSKLHSSAGSQGVFMRRYFGNFHRIMHEFDKTINSNFTLGINYKTKHLEIDLNGSAGAANGIIYSRQNAEFKQSGNLTYSRFDAGLLTKLGKFRSLHRLIMQTNSSEAVWSMPTVALQSAFYFEGHLFKKAMYARFGLDLLYDNGYTPYAYRPDLAWFYIQPGSRIAGNYPIADLFVSAEIKTVIITLKFEHINNNIVNYGVNNGYFSTSGYAIEPFRFLLGLVWRFHY